MYQAHWGLQESPFRGGLDVQSFHQSPTHEEALARLHFLVEERRRLGLLLGEAGSGKSLVFKVFAEQLRQGVRQVAQIGLVGASAQEFLWQLAAELGINPPSAIDLARLWRAIADRVVENRLQRIGSVVLLDDADEAGREVLAQVARLAQCDPSPDANLTVVLSAQSGRLDRLGLRTLELAELRIDLEPWELGDTMAYIRGALARAGASSGVFSDPGLARLHELAGGVPRRVKQLADLALLAGAGRQLNELDAATIESVFQELGVVSMSA